MSEHRDALAWAEAQVAAARDDPAARLALLARTYHGPTGCAPRHLPFRRAALSFMRGRCTAFCSVRSTRRRRAASGRGE